VAIITISRGSYSQGKQVAEKVAHDLGYDCVSRDILLDTSELFKIPELKLARAIHDAPSLLDRFSNGKQRYMAYIEAALLDLFCEDNIVYHGLAGHFFVQQIGHALKVRIGADLAERVRREAAASRVSEKEALRILKADDDQRRRWSRWLYGIDTTDPTLYDLVIQTDQLTAADAADIICAVVRRGCFETSAESKQRLQDLALAARVRAALVDRFTEIQVHAEKGAVGILVKSNAAHPEHLTEQIREIAARIRGVTRVAVTLKAISLFND